MGFCPLASGSKGNCTLFKSRKAKILIDAGLSGKSTTSLLAMIGVDVKEIDAILISHEHSDHIAGLRVLAFKLGIPVFANAETAKGIYSAFGELPQFKIFTTGESFRFNDIEIHPFSVQHDTPDPVMFTLKTDGVKVGICTDLGYPTTLVKNHLKECDHLILESNHEPSMVHASSRPIIYKQRVLGRSGHLSNESCAELLDEVFHPGLRNVFLAHLSQECNSPQTALDKVKARLGEKVNSLDLNIALQHTLSKEIKFS